MVDWRPDVDPLSLGELPNPGGAHRDDALEEAKFLQALDAVEVSRRVPSRFNRYPDANPIQPGASVAAIRIAFMLQQNLPRVDPAHWRAFVYHMQEKRLVFVPNWTGPGKQPRLDGIEYWKMPERISTHENGYMTLEDIVVPGVAPQEGGAGHRHAVSGLYHAVNGLAPLTLVAPAQSDHSAADLVCQVPDRSTGLACFAPFGQRQVVEFQVELSTAQNPRRRKANLLNSWARGSYPVMVLPWNKDDEPQTMCRRFDRLLRKDLGLDDASRLSERTWRALDRWQQRPFSIWTLVQGKQAGWLHVWQPKAEKLLDVGQAGAFGAEPP